MFLLSGTRLLIKDSPWIQMRNSFPKQTFIHPVKWSPILSGSKPHTQFYCKVVVPWMFNSTAKVPSFTPSRYPSNVIFSYKGLTELN